MRTPFNIFCSEYGYVFKELVAILNSFYKVVRMENCYLFLYEILLLTFRVVLLHFCKSVLHYLSRSFSDYRFCGVHRTWYTLCIYEITKLSLSLSLSLFLYFSFCSLRIFLLPAHYHTTHLPTYHIYISTYQTISQSA